MALEVRLSMELFFIFEFRLISISKQIKIQFPNKLQTT